MTKSSGEQRCLWCGGRFVQLPGRGRPRRFCRATCRQQAHLARKLAAGRQLAADEVIVSRADLETIQAAVITLQAALEDVHNDLADAEGPEASGEALAHLVAEAEPLASLWITPVTPDP